MQLACALHFATTSFSPLPGDVSGTGEFSTAVSEIQLNVEFGCESATSSSVSVISPTPAPEAEPEVVPSPTQNSADEPVDANPLGSSDGYKSASRNLPVFWMVSATAVAMLANTLAAF